MVVLRAVLLKFDVVVMLFLELTDTRCSYMSTSFLPLSASIVSKRYVESARITPE